jgi:hypothetical protein
VSAVSDVAKGLWSLLLLIALLLGLVFLIPLLVHLLIELPQLGWELAS